ncbi:histidine--tRNA ligase [Sneathia sanguinegens]|uniref:histidine--tRNA ligase n=1 Tax=Sneathia sanguinegens TaxID=40543 RepID=UPI00288A2DC4|nr:histidine--tRNA ligase [Sneathia sanguinegens]
MIQILKGMKDIHYLDMQKFEFITNTADSVFKKYGYSRLITPILEELALFKRSVGDETDVVSKEMYSFTDKGGREVALRPEGTASSVRAFLEAKLYNVQNITKWYYYGPMYRYEAPQKGRYREFYQTGLECFGVRDPFLDAQIISIACEFLEKLGIKNLTVEINSLGNIESRKKYIADLQKYLIANYEALSENSKVRCYKNPLRVLDSKEDDEIVANAPKLHDYFDEESKEYFDKVLNYLDKFKINYIINDKLVRGLDYYSDTVFEIKSNLLGAQATVLGGGRYDKLIEYLSNKSVPAIGFAAGIERIMLLLDETLLPKPKHKIFIAYFEETKDYLFDILEELKNINYEICYEYSIKNFSSQMKKANKLNADIVLILGENEQKNREISIKNFKDGQQITIPLTELKGVLENV